MSLLLSPTAGGPCRHAMRLPETLINRVDALNNTAVLKRQASKAIVALLAFALAAGCSGRNKARKNVRPVEDPVSASQEARALKPQPLALPERSPEMPPATGAYG